MGEFWQAENRLISKKYTTISFPFIGIEAPAFFITRNLTLDDVLEQLYSWSATQKFIAAKGIGPVAELKTSLLHVWGNPEEGKEPTWKLNLRVGRNE